MTSLIQEVQQSQARRSAPTGPRGAAEGAPLSSLEWVQKADRREAF